MAHSHLIMKDGISLKYYSMGYRGISSSPVGYNSSTCAGATATPEAPGKGQLCIRMAALETGKRPVPARLKARASPWPGPFSG